MNKDKGDGSLSLRSFFDSLPHRLGPDTRVAHHEVLPAEPARHGALAPPLPSPLAGALALLGLDQLYLHQAQAIDHIRDNKDVVVATPTASGKSLIYNLAVLEELLAHPEGRALYLFPIKALSRDQQDALQSLLGLVMPPFTTATYDGDTTPYQRSKIRQRPPHILISNPDMLHHGLLPYHDRWEALWRNLRFVVIDEMHTYRGVFGSHVALILRRLIRLCRFYGSRPRFILLSATIANPEGLAAQLIGDDRPLAVVKDHGAPRTKRHFLFMETTEPLTTLAARLVTLATAAGLKTIAFTKSRKATELISMAISRMAPELKGRISSYRAGFLPEERRSIEHSLSSGRLDAVVTTSALEMGIDIGGLDLCLLVGYPGTVMTTWQRGGRVGRAGRESAVMLLPQADALDQYIIKHPDEFLGAPFEVAVADPSNPEILKAHLPCAAAELPLTQEDVRSQGEAWRAAVEDLTAQGGLLLGEDGKQWYSPRERPHRLVDIRSIGPSYTILALTPEGKPIPLGKNDGIRALKECHQGAIYLHRGNSYQIESLDLQKRIIHASLNDAPYFTRVKGEKETDILEVLASRPERNFIVRLGRLKVTELLMGYERRRLFGQELLDFNPLELPPQSYQTVGFWLEMEPLLVQQVQARKLHFMGGIHAIEHAAISMFPLFALCDRADIGGISKLTHHQVGKAAIFIYDGYAGGIGLAARGYEMVVPLLEKAKGLIRGCPCEMGCPSCIHSPRCGAGNKPLDKAAALLTLEYLLGDRPLGEGLEVSPLDVTPIRQPAPEVNQPRIGYFDLETQRLAADVGGWENKHLMRVSVAVIYETPAKKYHVYREGDVAALVKRLQGLDLVVGFNIKSFDYAVLSAYTPFDFKRLPTFDILERIHQQLGFRLSLDHLASKTLERRKLADGLQAVQWFREENWEPLTAYCQEDVALTRDLFLFALDKGYLIYEDKRGRRLRVPTAWKMEEILGEGRERAPGSCRP